MPRTIADTVLAGTDQRSRAYEALLSAEESRSRAKEILGKGIGYAIGGEKGLFGSIKGYQEEKDQKEVDDAVTAAMTEYDDPDVAMEVLSKTPAKTAKGSQYKLERAMDLENLQKKRALHKLSLEMKDQELIEAQDKRALEQEKLSLQTRQRAATAKAYAPVGDPLYSGERPPSATEIASRLAQSGQFTPEQIDQFSRMAETEQRNQELARQFLATNERLRESSEEKNKLTLVTATQKQELDLRKQVHREAMDLSRLGFDTRKWDTEAELRDRKLLQEDQQFQQNLAAQDARQQRWIEARLQMFAADKESQMDIQEIRALQTHLGTTTSESNRGQIMEKIEGTIGEMEKAMKARNDALLKAAGVKKNQVKPLNEMSEEEILQELLR